MNANKINKLPLIALCLGYFMVIIDLTVVNVVMPSIAHSLHGDMQNLQWIIDAYTLSFACLLLSSGYFSDRFGAKKIFLYGLSIFILASFACGMATDFSMLILYRFFQGVGAAMIMPSSLALLHGNYQSSQQRAWALGIWGCLGGIAAASGPILGAILGAYLSWRAVFFINLPVGVFAIIMTYTSVAEPAVTKKKQFDLYGQLLAVVSSLSLVMALINVGHHSWLSWPVFSNFLIFFIATTAFIFVEFFHKAPMLPLTLFKSSTFTSVVLIALIFTMGFYGVLFLLPIYFQQIHHYSILMTGAAIFPLMALMALSSYYGGRLASQLGPRLPIIWGLLIGAVGFFITLFTIYFSLSYWVMVLPLMMIGFGSALTLPNATFAAIHSVSNQQAGIASGAFNTARQLGSLIGVALFGTIVSLNTYFVTGMIIALIIAGISYLFAGLVASLGVKHC